MYDIEFDFKTAITMHHLRAIIFMNKPDWIEKKGEYL
jgi:hypothetical protein